MVGKAVFAGSGNRGGWKYQALAMFLTYASIVSSYVPSIVEELQKQQNVATSDVKNGNENQEQAAGGVVDVDAPSPPPTPQAQTDQPLTMSEIVIGLLAILALAFALPFLAGIENIMGFIIIGIGLYEAWKFNRRQERIIDGPYQVGADPAASSAAS